MMRSPAATPSIRLSVLIDALLLSLVPLGMNILRVFDPLGSKMPALLILLLIVAKNLLVLPGVGQSYARNIYRSPMGQRFDSRILLPLTILLIVLSIAVARGLGFAYTFGNAISNVALCLLGLASIVSAFFNTRNDSERHLLLKAAPVGIFQRSAWSCRVAIRAPAARACSRDQWVPRLRPSSHEKSTTGSRRE